MVSQISFRMDVSYIYLAITQAIGYSVVIDISTAY